MTYRAFAAAMRTSSRATSSRQPSYTDRDWERKKEEYQRRADSPQAREMSQIMRGKR